VTRVIVVGAGVTGLSAAHELARSGIDVTVLGGGQVGGKVSTSRFAGYDVDRSADAFLARVPDGIELCRELGIDGELVSPAARRAYVYSRGALRLLPEAQVLGVPTDLDELAASGIVSEAGVSAARADLTTPGAPPAGDETIGAFIRRRLGDEVLERLVDPLVGGINAGDTDDLSLAAVTPQLDAAARSEEPSLIRACAAQRALGDATKPVFFAPVGGMGVLVDTLVRSLDHAGVELRSEAIAREVGRDGVIVLDCGRRVAGDGVIVATPASVAATILAGTSERAATLLATIRTASVALVTLAFARDGIDHALDGSGYLVPRNEGTLLTACSWASSKWSHLAGDGSTVIVRASAGRAGDDRWADLDDRELTDRIVTDLGQTMGAQVAPTEVRVDRWPRAFPQYRPGHLALVDAAEQALRTDAPRIVVAGAALRGLGVPACIRQGREAARALLAGV
jgi:oxygen-dependent protoporphyrinogen oxidase